jgi:hypothetical protein
MADLTEEEMNAVTETFFRRLGDAMSNSSCNDLFPDEWPQSVIDKFSGDGELFEYWKSRIAPKE